ncbi:hypothetical protein BST61_g4413 [Cercospora zeina]
MRIRVSREHAILTTSNDMSEQCFSGWVSKPHRMRSACCECHAAKIRCCGQKSGCQRCSSLGLHCEYVISLVGRTPRRRKQHEHDDTDGQREDSHSQQPERRNTFSGVKSTTPSSNNEPSATIAPSDIFSGQQTTFIPSSSLHEQPDMMEEEPDFDFFCSEERMTNDISLPSADNNQIPSQINISTYTQKSQPIVGKGRGSASTTITAAAAQNAVSQFATAQIVGVSPHAAVACGVTGVSTTVPADANNTQPQWSQWPNLMAICVMMRQLEVQKDDEGATLDKIMLLSQVCIKELMTISNQEQFNRHISCSTMVAAVLKLIVTLYERVILLQAERQVAKPGGSAALTQVPPLQFGCFELDLDEQNAFRDRIIRKEAQESSHREAMGMV